MYSDYFGLKLMPFNNTPDPRFFFSTPDHEEALASLIYAVREMKGCVLLTGEVGTGKTLVSRVMMRQFAERIAYANVTHSTRSAVDLMESVCAEFNLAVPEGASNASLVRILQDHLLAEFAANRPVVLVLDEAQNLSIDAFEQLRMIGNLEADDAKLLQIVILGQPELQELIRSPRLRQLHQRIFRSFHLTALSPALTADYIRHRLAVAGAEGGSAIFDDEAIGHVHAFSQGLPRLINTVCDNAMLAAYSAGVRSIDGPFVQRVVEQLRRETSEPRGGESRRAAPAVSDPAVARASALESAEQPHAQRHTRARQRGDADGMRDRRTSERASAPPDGREEQVPRLSASLHALVGQVYALRDEVARIKRQAAAPADAARQTLDELQASCGEARRLIDEHRATRQSVDASRRQAHKLAALIKATLEQTRVVVARLNATTVRADQAERQGLKACQQLRGHAERAEQLVSMVRQLFERLEHQVVSLASATIPAPVIRGNGSASGGQVLCERVEGDDRVGNEKLARLLAGTHGALRDLRSLADHVPDGMGVAAGAGDASDSRLLRQMNDLLRLVDDTERPVLRVV